jgi:release factor glutamine methyltransferase
MGVGRDELLLHHLDGAAPDGFNGLLTRRLGHEPIAYIIGSRDFWTISLSVGPGVLIPRADSETLIEAAVELFAGRSPKTIIDLGTGPGTLLLAALSEFPKARGIGIDSSEIALSYANHNAETLGLSDRAAFQQGDWANGLEGQFDLILCNPPYIELDATLDPQVVAYEPHQALFGGQDGLVDYRRLASQLAALIAPQGVAILEIGHHQAKAVSALFTGEGLGIKVKHDLAGRDRCLIMQRQTDFLLGMQD